MTMAAGFADPVSLPRGNRRIVIGIAVSLAVHALLVLAYRNTHVWTMDLAPAEPTVISVMIAPPAPPPPPPEPVVARVVPVTPVATRVPRAAVPKAVIAVPEGAITEPEPFVVQQQEEATPAAPAFDMNAAREVARANAHLRDPSREGTALARLPEPALQTETRLARGIANAKRPDCKDGIPGGLLAPVYLLMKKKDSGCKW